MEIVIGIIVFAAIIHVVIAGIVLMQVQILSKPQLQTVSEEQGGQVPPAEQDGWAVENEFAFIGNFTMKIGPQLARIAVWQRMDRPTFFCWYVIEAQNRTQQACDLVTIFADEVGLTTGSTKDSQLFPHRPGSFMQSFSQLSLDEQWGVHIEMENYLMDQGQAELVPLEKPFETLILDAISKQMQYVKTIPLWPLRGAYWFFVRRNKWHGKTIKEQYEKGWITLPNQLQYTHRLEKN